jgi:hypothetical protein
MRNSARLATVLFGIFSLGISNLQGQVAQPQEMRCIQRNIFLTCVRWQVVTPALPPDFEPTGPPLPAVPVPVDTLPADTVTIQTDTMSVDTLSADSVTQNLPSVIPATPSVVAQTPRPLVYQTPRHEVCNLGTAYAVWKDRPVLPGEKEMVTDRDYNVRVNQREAPGSNRIVWRDCLLPSGTVAIYSAAGVWIKACGNDVIGIPTSFVPGPAGEVGPQGPIGPIGPQGDMGPAGLLPVSPPGSWSWLKWPAGGIIVGAVVYIAAKHTLIRVRSESHSVLIVR